MKVINIGYGNIVNTDHIVAVISPDSAPIKRMIQSAKENGTLIDATYGKRTLSVIVTDTDKVILSIALPETIGKRFV